MSHCYGAKCEDHGHVLVPDGCPERECGGASHGFTYVECSERCPDYQRSEVSAG